MHLKNIKAALLLSLSFFTFYTAAMEEPTEQIQINYEQYCRDIAKKLHDNLNNKRDIEERLNRVYDQQDRAEIAKQYFYLYGEVEYDGFDPEIRDEQFLNVNCDYGFSIEELLKNNMIPCIEKSFGFIRLNLDNLRINNLEGIKEIPNIGCVQVLYLRRNRLTDIKHQAFKGFNNVEYLFLDSNIINNIETHAFEGLDKLDFLYLKRNPTLKAIPPKAFYGLNKLENLFFCYSKLTDFSMECFDYLPQLSEISFLGNELPNTCIEKLQLYSKENNINVSYPYETCNGPQIKATIYYKK